MWVSSSSASKWLLVSKFCTACDFLRRQRDQRENLYVHLLQSNALQCVLELTVGAFRE